MRRLLIDRTRCDGHGSCAELLPELLDLDEWGFPVSLNRERDPVVHPSLTDHARRAVRACPLMALRLS
jgi:ferredoxin